MSWRDSLRPASFRGASFYVASADTEFGRRTVLWEFPLRDEPGAVDLGRRARRYKVEAFVVGADYMVARDQLRAAIEQAGPGELVHPFLGTLQVRLDGAVRVHESTTEGGWAQFSLSFVEAGEADFGPRASVDTAAVLQAAVGLAQALPGIPAAESVLEAAALAATEEFAAGFDVSGLPEEIRGSIVSQLLAGVAAVMDATRGYVRLVEGAADTLLAEVDKFANDVADLMNAPLALAGRFIQLTATLYGLRHVLPHLPDGQLISPTNAAMRAWRSAWFAEADLTGEPPPEDTAAGRRIMRSYVATVRLGRVAATLATAAAAAELSWESHDEAVAAREELSAGIQELETEAATDDAYSALRDLRAAVWEHLGAVAGELPRIARVTLQESAPALVLAHRLYGDATRETEIVRRNRVRHPGFLPAGQPLEVLVDG